MRHTYHAEQWLPYPIDLVFAFFANPENLPRLMPSWQKARIEEAAFAPPPSRPTSTETTKLRSIVAGSGTKLTLSFRPFPYSPLRIPWDAEIVDFVWNDHFCDHQLRGPFAYWHHCHSVRPETRASVSGTLLRDEVEYEVPMGKLGDIANSLVISRQLRRTFNYRHGRTSALLATLSQPS